MSEHKTTVTLTIDTGPFVAAMEQAARAVVRFAQVLERPPMRHLLRHHWPERPERSAMHAAYDQRRRARRRRARR